MVAKKEERILVGRNKFGDLVVANGTTKRDITDALNLFDGGSEPPETIVERYNLEDLEIGEFYIFNPNKKRTGKTKLPKKRKMEIPRPPKRSRTGKAPQSRNNPTGRRTTGRAPSRKNRR